MTLATQTRDALRKVCDPARAPAMQAYMKSSMPFLGVPTPLRRKVCRELYRDLRWKTANDWQRDVLHLWRDAQFREERYCAIELSGQRAARPFQTLEALPLYEEMIVSGAWWDYVDAIATLRLGPLLRNDRDAMTRTMLEWSTDPDMWKRRSAILCQIGAKRETDLDLLYACIEPSLCSREFFLRKAIGWALRQYAWIDPAEVRRYVSAAGQSLSALSRREALKNIGPAA